MLWNIKEEYNLFSFKLTTHCGDDTLQLDNYAIQISQ